jgi:hypothetical protein
MMKRLASIVLAAAALSGTPAAANHLWSLDTPFPTRGACEAATTEIDNFDRDGLLVRFPELYDTRGDTRAFITKAFSCERDAVDGKWYITDHLQERLASDWFLRRQD